jgi:chromate transporter
MLIQRGTCIRLDDHQAPNLIELPRPVSLREAIPTWCRVAAQSFGGPAGQIAVMHRIVVDEKRWISEERFLHALNFCMLLPGPEATQLATYIGWLMHGTAGGLAAGILFILPGIVAIFALSVFYAAFQDTAIVAALLFGLKPAVIAIVIEAVVRIGKRVLTNGTMLAIAAVSFLAIHLFRVPFPAVVLAAAAIGFLGGRIAPKRFSVIKQRADAPVNQAEDSLTQREHPSHARSLLTCLVGLGLWFGPLCWVFWSLGRDSVFARLAVFFSQAAVVTFGGAYAVLAYVAQRAVETYAWLRPGEMLDGLGMAETTPGPLIMVLQFVGFMAGYRQPAPFAPLLAGAVGSAITTWVTFAPCFLWIFLGAPYVERLRDARSLTSALSTITAAVVGVVLNLAVWFAIHTLFRRVSTVSAGPMRLLVPDWTSLDPRALAIAIVACLMTLVWKRGMTATLAVCAALGIGAVLLFGR